ncbi:MAG: hypothetical protein FWG72_02305 [Oscillospiraceae bacterium]|nr:hypothetical protein [Oscillospiraceae bacterium]
MLTEEEFEIKKSELLAKM